ncbi:MAG: 7-carboxy-7-deazaguanine synthase QueE [Acidobacteria bacterium]|nr:7-carboxy-7-deazaguanine synthase QueE [Acidobacteriota bacterium]
MRINEIFWSFQGEGLRVGVPSIFLRLAGCRVKCLYCDTKDAWEHGTWMSQIEILAAITKLKKKYPESQVVITGGEPLEQDLGDLVSALKTDNYFLAIETSGMEYADLAIDWWTVSPKDVSNYTINKNLYKRMNEVKLIVNENLTLDVIKTIRAVGDYFTIFLQPNSNDAHRYDHTFHLFEQCQLAGLTNIRPGIQLHKVYQVM